MDFRLYDPVLDPVIVVCHDRIVRYLNPAATKWLTIAPDDTPIGQPLTTYVDFAGSQELAAVPQMPFFTHSQYGISQFKLKLTQYEGMAKLAVQRYPSDLYTMLFALFVRERAFAQIMSDRETVELINRNQQKTAAELMPDRQMFGEEEKGISQLDQETINKVAPKGRLVKYESQANVFFTAQKKAARGVTVAITDDGIDVLIKRFDGLIDGIECSLEVVGNAHLRGFSTLGFVNGMNAVRDDVVIHVKFGKLSPMVTSAIQAFLDKNSTKI